MLGLTQESATDVLAGLLYALGHRPHESLLVGLVEGGRVKATLRLDLSDAMSDPLTVAAVGARSAGYLRMASAVVAVVTDDVTVPGLAFGEDVARGLEALGVPCLDVFAVASTTFRTRHLGPVPMDELRSTLAAARAVSQGATIADSRAALLADVEPDTADRLTADAGAVDAVQVLTRWTADLAGTQEAPTEPGALLAALGRPALRDAVIAAVLAPTETDPQRLMAMTADDVEIFAARPPVASHVARATALLAALARRAERPADVLAVLAWVAWWGKGDGARASQLAERALADRPRHRLARLALELTDRQVPPPWRS